MCKLWLDDLREMPSSFDVWCKTSAEALEILEKHPYPVSAISFDHDLGGEDTGYRVAQWIERAAHDHAVQRMGWRVHSANPVGKQNIEMAMYKAEHFWDEMDLKFMRLRNDWHHNTRFMSSAMRMAEDENHKAIVAMGRPIVGKILRYIHDSPDHLFIALREILGDGPEIPEHERGRVHNMCDLWYAWGRKQGYVHEVL
jgi:hypothetical protein